MSASTAILCVGLGVVSKPQAQQAVNATGSLWQLTAGHVSMADTELACKAPDEEHAVMSH